MKYIINHLLYALLFIAMIIGYSETYAGSDWEDLLKGVKVLKGSNIIDDGEWHEGLVYNAYVKFRFINGDGDNSFDPDEKVYLYIKGGDGSIYETPTTGYTREELKTWALERAKGLIQAVFSLDPTQTTTGISYTITDAQFINDSILSSPFNRPQSDYSEVRNKIGLGQYGEKESRKKDKSKEILLRTFTSEVKLDSEKGRIRNTINGFRATGNTQGSIVKWERYMFDNKSIGLVVTYKAVDMNDYWSTETKTLSLVPNFKWIINLNKKIDLSTVVYLRGGVIYFKSNVFPDGAGYLSYGGGFAIQPTYHIKDRSNLSFLAGYSITKKWIPESAVSEEIKFVADAINKMDPIQTFSLGASLKYNILMNWFTELSFVYVNIFKGEGIPEGRKKANYYVFRSYYKFWKKLKLGIGYKMVRNVSDYKEDAYMVNLSYEW